MQGGLSLGAAFGYHRKEAASLEAHTRQQAPPSPVIIKRLIHAQVAAQSIPTATPTTPVPVSDAHYAAVIALLDAWLKDAVDDPEALRRSEGNYEKPDLSLSADRAVIGVRPVLP